MSGPVIVIGDGTGGSAAGRPHAIKARSASAKGVWDAIFILYVIWPALLLYQITKQAGAYDALRQGIAHFSRNELFIILALIVANGVFAGAEIAIVSLRRTRLQQLVDADRVGAKRTLVAGLALQAIAVSLYLGTGRLAGFYGVAVVFGFAYGQWGWPLWASILLAAAFGGLCGAVNGFLIAYIGYPALITTLATYYAFSSIAIVINNQQPISTRQIQDFFSAARSISIVVTPGA